MADLTCFGDKCWPGISGTDTAVLWLNDHKYFYTNSKTKHNKLLLSRQNGLADARSTCLKFKNKSTQ